MKNIEYVEVKFIAGFKNIENSEADEVIVSVPIQQDRIDTLAKWYNGTAEYDEHAQLKAETLENILSSITTMFLGYNDVLEIESITIKATKHHNEIVIMGGE